jgi:hypothetical protein
VWDGGGKGCIRNSCWYPCNIPLFSGAATAGTVGASVAYVTIVIPSVTSLFILRGGHGWDGGGKGCIRNSCCYPCNISLFSRAATAGAVGKRVAYVIAAVTP